MGISKTYGGYGGVTRKTKYVPPQVSNYTPQETTTIPPQVLNYTLQETTIIPPKPRYIPPPVPGFIPQPASIPYTQTDREKIEGLAGDNSPILNLNNILVRTQTQSLSSDVDNTFTIATLGNPNYKLTYTIPATSTQLDMLRTDGGSF